MYLGYKKKCYSFTKKNTCISCTILFLDGEGVTFVLDRFDPGGGGTISCSGLTPGDISVPFEVRHRELAFTITRKEKHSFFKDINCSYNLMFVLIILVYTFLYRCPETPKKLVMVQKVITLMP